MKKLKTTLYHLLCLLIVYGKEELEKLFREELLAIVEFLLLVIKSPVKLGGLCCVTLALLWSHPGFF